MHMKQQQERQYTLLIQDEGDGMLWAKVQELPGCFASGATMDELMEAAAEAIEMYLCEEQPAQDAGDAEPPADVVPIGSRGQGVRPHHCEVRTAQIALEA